MQLRGILTSPVFSARGVGSELNKNWPQLKKVYATTGVGVADGSNVQYVLDALLNRTVPPPRAYYNQARYLSVMRISELVDVWVLAGNAGILAGGPRSVDSQTHALTATPTRVLVTHLSHSRSNNRPDQHIEVELSCIFGGFFGTAANQSPVGQPPQIGFNSIFFFGKRRLAAGEEGCGPSKGYT